MISHVNGTGKRYSSRVSIVSTKVGEFKTHLRGGLQLAQHKYGVQQYHGVPRKKSNGKGAAMEVAEILGELKYYQGHFPREALKSAQALKHEITPFLLDIINNVIEKVEDITNDANYMAHVFAMYLLAKFKEKKFYPSIIKFSRLPGKLALDLTGDIVTEDLARIFASDCHGDLWPIKNLIEDRDINEWVRCAGISSLKVMAFVGLLKREEVMEYYATLFRGRLEREYSHVWNALASCATEMYPERVFADIKRAYDDELVAPFSMRLSEVEEVLARDKQSVWENSKHYCKGLIGDTIEEMENWACFKAEKKLTRDHTRPVPKSLNQEKLRRRSDAMTLVLVEVVRNIRNAV